MSFYITISQPPKSHQITLEDILTKELPVYAFQQPTGESYTLTRVANSVTKQTLANARIRHAVQSILEFNETYKDLFEQPREKLYHTFYIPKKSGGLRRIDEPNPELMGALRRLKEILESDFHAMHHTAAFAYVKGRSTINSLERHQRNHSNWFLKTDFSNFFGSTTLEFTLSMLKIIFPFNYVYELYPDGWKALGKALELGFLNGGLPQGTPLSPALTNLIMLPIDHRLKNDLIKRKEKFCYTRYADDILISSRRNFTYSEVVNYIDEVLEEFHAPFRIKAEKTRYGSSAGANWNLGVMLNKDGNITIGWRKKKQFHAMVHNFITDFNNNKHWELSDVQTFSGLLSYYYMIEPSYMKGYLDHVYDKYKVNLRKLIRIELNRKG